MRKGEDLTARYKDYAVYLPSLQQQYADYPLRKRDTVREGKLPAKMQLQDLDAYSGVIRPLIPKVSGHPFRFYPATDSGASGHPCDVLLRGNL